MAQLKLDKPRGILHPREGASRFQLLRYHPSPGLSGLLEHFWTVRWDLRGMASHTQEVLPHPTIHLSFEQGRAEIVGVVSCRFERMLEGEGRVFAAKFLPGGFAPFYPGEICELTDRRLPVEELFGEAGADLHREVLAVDDHDAARAIEDFLLERRGLEPGEQLLQQIRSWVALAEADRGLLRVEQLADKAGVSVRSLQRCFRRYVGVSPKWVLQRYRLHEALEQADQGDVDWARLAVDLGYFDQAHFAKDFRAMIGVAPGQYGKHRAT